VDAAGEHQRQDERALGALADCAADRVLGRLLGLRERGELSRAAVLEAAVTLGRSERTVWRWLAAGSRPAGVPGRGFQLSDELRDAYLGVHGNVASVWRREVAAGRHPPPLRTLQRAFARELRPAERAGARAGEAGIRSHSLYLRYEAPHRNAVWQADHKQLAILVVPAGSQRALRPWMTVFLDDFSRAVMGWAISLRPSAAEVLAALRDSVLPDPERGPFGGVPSRLRWDNGLEFAAAAVSEAGLALGIELDPTTAYAPHEKGKVERFNRTTGQMLLSTLPRYCDGPRDARGRLLDTGAPLGYERFVGLFAPWVHTYNTSREHAGLAGLTPLERWREDPTPLQEIAPVDARALLAARSRRRVRRDGIHHRGSPYVAPELCELVGEDVEVAFAPHDQRQVEVYWRGSWVCTAYPQHTLSADEQQRVLAERRDYAAELHARQRRALRNARGRLEPATAANHSPEEVTVLPDTVGVERRQRRGEELARHARTDLLLPAGGPRARE